VSNLAERLNNAHIVFTVPNRVEVKLVAAAPRGPKGERGERGLPGPPGEAAGADDVPDFTLMYENKLV
jgi:hypothetical protein